MKLVKALLLTTTVLAVSANAKSHFEGTFVGVNIGSSKAGNQKATQLAHNAGAAVTIGKNEHSRKWGVNGGLTVGHRAAAAQDVILGVSLGVDMESTKAKTSNQLGGATGATFKEVTSEVKRRYIVNLLGQAGYTVTKDFMPYITAGVSFTQFRLSAGTPNGQLGGSKNKTKFGYAVGAGAAYAINDTVSADLNYLYTGYGNTKYTSAKTIAGTRTEINVKAPKGYHTVTVGVKVNI